MLGVRLPKEMQRELSAVAHRQGRTRSEVAREAIRHYLRDQGLASEARRQSVLVSESESQDEVEAGEFILHATDLGHE